MLPPNPGRGSALWEDPSRALGPTCRVVGDTIVLLPRRPVSLKIGLQVQIQITGSAKSPRLGSTTTTTLPPSHALVAPAPPPSSPVPNPPKCSNPAIPHMHGERMLVDHFLGRGPSVLFPTIGTSHLQHADSVYA